MRKSKLRYFFRTLNIFTTDIGLDHFELDHEIVTVPHFERLGEVCLERQMVEDVVLALSDLDTPDFPELQWSKPFDLGVLVRPQPLHCMLAGVHIPS